MESKRAVGYIRVAAPEQANPRRGLDAQAAAISSAANAAGIVLVRVFEDSGESAHNMSRPGLLALPAAVEAGLVNVVIVPDLSRLARDVDHLRRLRESLDKHGVRLISADQLCDPSK
jgi:DNA invertase Pin-like site-specific DNA recombinase